MFISSVEFVQQSESYLFVVAKIAIIIYYKLCRTKYRIKA